MSRIADFQASGKVDRPVRSSPFGGSSSSEPSTASARKPSVDRSIPIVPDRASLVAADDFFDSSDLSRAASHSASNPTQQADSTMALPGDALTAILAAQAEANRQNMVSFGETLATSLARKSTEDQARTDALIKTMQDQIKQQDQTMHAMIRHLDKSRHPEGSLSTKDTPDVDEFKHSSVADEGAQSDFLIAFGQICAHMEATGKLTSQVLFR